MIERQQHLERCEQRHRPEDAGQHACIHVRSCNRADQRPGHDRHRPALDHRMVD